VLLRMGTTIWVRGNLPVVDVRDVAAVHAAAMRPAQGPRRYLCGGHFVPFGDLLGMLERGSERRLRRVPVPGAGLRAAGWLTDRISTVLPVPAILTHEASIVLTRAQPTDDSATHSDLKVHWRSTDESIAAALETAPTHEEA
jgi:dihydroflavonol-4-reductase